MIEAKTVEEVVTHRAWGFVNAVLSWWDARRPYWARIVCLGGSGMRRPAGHQGIGPSAWSLKGPDHAEARASAQARAEGWQVDEAYVAPGFPGTYCPVCLAALRASRAAPDAEPAD